MPHVSSLPIIEPFTAVGLTFTDQRSADSAASSDAFDAWGREMGAFFARLGVGLGDMVCRPNNEQMELDTAQFHVALEADPDLDFMEWQATRPLHREHDPDPLKPDYFFCARDSETNECAGGLALANIEIQSDTSDGVVCGGIILPGIRTDDIVETWSAIYTHILTAQFALDDGRTLDFTDHQILPNFQSEEVLGLRAKAVNDQVTADLLELMAVDFDIEGELSDPSQTVHIRRRVA